MKKDERIIIELCNFGEDIIDLCERHVKNKLSKEERDIYLNISIERTKNVLDNIYSYRM